MAEHDWTQAAPGPCKHLLSKEMLYGGDDSDDDGSGIYWCDCTQTCLGPDRRPVDKADCTPDRECYESD